MANTLHRIRSYTFAGIDICRANPRKFGGFESNALVCCCISHTQRHLLTGVSGARGIGYFMVAGIGGLIRIYPFMAEFSSTLTIHAHCFMCHTRSLKILLSGDDSPILMLKDFIIDLT